MREKTVRLMSLVVCGVCLLLGACSDNPSQDTPPTPAANQTGSDQGPGSQSQPQTAPDKAGQSLSSSDGGKCDALLTARCTVCHNTTRICEKLGKKSKSRWQRTIDRMTARGAKLNAEEAAALLVCLDSGTKDLQSACR